jgi:hypothetical protein
MLSIATWSARRRCMHIRLPSISNHSGPLRRHQAQAGDDLRQGQGRRARRQGSALHLRIDVVRVESNTKMKPQQPIQIAGVFVSSVAGTRNIRFFSICRTGDSPVRRMATLSMFESLHVVHPAESAIWRDILRRSRRRLLNDVTLVTDATAALGSEGMKAAATNARCSHTPPKH